MQFSEQWLRQWVNPNNTTDELCEQLTMLGLEVDACKPVAGDFQGVVVGEVVTREQHPNADRLSYCQVNVGEEAPLSIVCGAPNVRQGLKVAVVKVGGVLPGDFKIKKAKLRGVESHGMICSQRELGLSEEHNGILELPADAPVGMDFREYYQLNDHMIDIDLTPNRGDCLSLRGISREIATLNNLELASPDKLDVTHQVESSITETFPITLSQEAACPRYVGRVIRNIDANAKTPLWMQERLRRSGFRCIQLLVDLTNYVLLELGQPMHAFDLQKLQGGIEVRYAKAGEKITLLDEQDITLKEDTLVIADEQGPQAMAGVMGGLDSAVDENTQHIFLESAFFAPSGISRASRQYGIQSDSSFRFERGVDFELQKIAVERYTQLLLEIAGGEPGPVVDVAVPEHLPKLADIMLRRDQIKRLLGIEIKDQQVEQILTGLGLTVASLEQGWQVSVPSYRFDLRIEADLIEELARLYGYESIPGCYMQGELKTPMQSESTLPHLRIQRLLVDAGYHEAVTYSFVDEKTQKLLDPERDTIALANPLASDMAVMRTTLWPGLIKALQYNLNRQVSRVCLFETGLCFIKEGDALSQVAKLGGVVAGSAHTMQWGQKTRGVDFFDVKGDIELLLLLSSLQHKVSWHPSEHPALHPGQSAALYHQGECIGLVGALHPSIVSELGLSLTPFVFELNLNILEKTTLPKYSAISKFPAVRRDLAVVIDQNISVAELEKKVLKFARHLLIKLRIFDIYQGEGIEFGKKSVAMGLTFQDPSRTLVDSEINEIIDRVVSGLQQDLNAILRA